MNEVLVLKLGLPLFAASSLAWIAGMLLNSLRLESSASKNLRSYAGEEGKPAALDVVGDRIAGRFPASLAAWSEHLRWAQRGGFFPGAGIGRVLVFALLLGVGGGAVMLIHPAPAFLPIPLIGFALPFVVIRSRANKVRRQVVRALPETAALVAAEVSAGSPPEQALERAASLPGPLAGFLAEANVQARKTGRPLFSRRPVRGVLVEAFGETGLPELRAFALQIDEVAGKGVDSAELMNDVARSLAREHRSRMMAEKEQLGGKLTTAVAFFFFFPAVLLILAAFLVPMIQMF